MNCKIIQNNFFYEIWEKNTRKNKNVNKEIEYKSTPENSELRNTKSKINANRELQQQTVLYRRKHKWTWKQIIWSEEKKEEKMTKNEKSLQNIWDTIKTAKFCIIGVSEEETEK